MSSRGAAKGLVEDRLDAAGDLHAVHNRRDP
jgi:hypothetical protein